ncbi:related to phosphoribosyl-5-aminoimidazole carboxylase [Cephalotrichum gorgonifer]|uniref:Phosphoribosylaminoimidazole carboxylase n=1 Tax=Cephalotrichum gorgonifer TaxID=2041049 RepID=A0AAE8N4B3_9PEZI|nr:related to phosphoribosyl-5-aminoimidazole carboxylase [Cephalotrichum gorgonifer]
MPAGNPIIGLLGGGQLGRMLCEAAGPLGVEVAVLDAADCPTRQINTSSHHVAGSFKDADKIRELARRSDFLSVEIEHVDAHTLADIEKNGVKAADGSVKKVEVHPAPRSLDLIRDKFQQKAHFAKAGVPVAAQMELAGGDIEESLLDAGEKFGFPFMAKSRTDSYDGRGNVVVRGPASVHDVAQSLGREGLYAEKMVKFTKELAVMVIRAENEGAERTYAYPAVETVHQDSICTTVYMPPRGVSEETCKAAQALARKVVGTLWGRGVFAVEMFLTADGELVVNEVAPRPHNSGHYTIEAVPQMSQYKAQLYAILGQIPEGLKLTPRVSSSIMVNILGGAAPEDYERLVALTESAYDDDMDVHLHLYGKASKPGRKIGHITLTGTGSIEDLEKRAQAFLDLAETLREERLSGASVQLRPQKEAAASPAAAPGAAEVLVTMGSDSDLPVLKAGLDILRDFGVPTEVRITSAHRTPGLMAEVAEAAAGRGIKVIIAAAGGAAHLPGMAASHTPLPVIGVPVKATHLDGVDSLYSIVQMPRGIPVATVGINNSTNAALLAIRILGAQQPGYMEKMSAYMKKMETEVNGKAAKLLDQGYEAYLAGMPKK